MATTAFFATDNVQNALRNALGVLNRAAPELHGREALVEHCCTMLRILLNNPGVFDINSRQNIEWIGAHLSSQLTNLKAPDDWTTDAEDKFVQEAYLLFATLFRFIKEFQFSISGELSHELESVSRYATRMFHVMPEDAKEIISYANYVMPAQIIKQMLHSEEIRSFLDFKAKSASAEEMKQRWDAEISQKSKVISDFTEKLKNLTTDYNFVGLQHGFAQIHSEKKKEQQWARAVMLMLGALTLVPILFHLGTFYFNHSLFASRTTELVYVAPAFLAVELILIYFFRIALQNANSVRVQLLQLKLRMTLCQFIQSYSEYSAPLKQKDPASLDRFESLVFSQIAPDEGTLPSTLDGIEQIGKLVQAVKSPR